MPDGAGHAGDPPRGARDRGGASACGRAAGRLRRVEQHLDELDLDLEGEVRERRRGRVHRGRMRRLPHTRRRPQSRDGRSQPRPAQAQHGDGREAGRERRRRDAGIPWTAHTRPDPRRRPVRRTKRQQLIGACQRQRLLALDLRNASGSIRLAAGQQHACWSSNPAVRSALCRLPLSEGRRCRGLAFWRRPGKWQGLDGSPRFPLPERLCAVRDGPGVPAVAPLPGTFPGACYGTRRASWDSKTICLQALGRPGAVPVRRPGRGSGYGPVPAGRWALTPRATRNSAATSLVAASAPSGNT